MDGRLLSLKHQVMAMETPMQILGIRLEANQDKTQEFVNNVSRPLGAPQLWEIIMGTGILLAILVVIVQLIKLLIVNYPKTVTQTKQKVAHAVFVIVTLVSLAAIFDTVLGITQKAIGMGFH